MASSELHQPQQGGEPAKDLTSDPFLPDRLAENPATFGTVVTRSHHLYFVPIRNKYNLLYYAIRYLIKYSSDFQTTTTTKKKAFHSVTLQYKV
jgi:hypothetical protein